MQIFVQHVGKRELDEEKKSVTRADLLVAFKKAR